MNRWRAILWPLSNSSIEGGGPLEKYFPGVAAVGLALTFIGCGGSGGGGGSSSLTPHQTIRASALSTYQSVAALSAFPIEALEAAAPAGSNITAVPTVLAAAQTPTLALVHHTGLYSAGATPTAGGAVFNYYQDANGTEPAGTMRVTSGTGTFTYAQYPAVISISIKITAGNLPCQGTAKITFSGSSGAAEMVGNLQLLKNHEAVTFDLLLSSDHQVSGALLIGQNGMTLAASNLSGPLVGDQSFDFTDTPSGYNGSGTLDLISPTITLLFTEPAGASASIDANHHMVIHYPSAPGLVGGDEDLEAPIIDGLIDDSGDDTSGDTSGDTTGGDTTSGDTSGSTDSSTTGSTTDGSTTGDDGCDTATVKARAKGKK